MQMLPLTGLRYVICGWHLCSVIESPVIVTMRFMNRRGPDREHRLGRIYVSIRSEEKCGVMLVRNIMDH